MADSCYNFEIMYNGEDADIAFFEKRLAEIWSGKLKDADLNAQEKKLKKAVKASEDEAGDECFEGGGSFADYEYELAKHTFAVDTGDALVSPSNFFMSPFVGAFPNLDFYCFQTFSCDTGRSFASKFYRRGERKYVPTTGGWRMIPPYFSTAEMFFTSDFGTDVEVDYGDALEIADRYVRLCVNTWKKDFVDGKMAELCEAGKVLHIFDKPEGFKAEYDEFIKKHSVKMTEKQALEMIEGGTDLDDIPEELRTQEVCLAAVQKKPEPGEIKSPLAFVPEKIITEEMCRIAVQNSVLAFGPVPVKFKTPEICRIAVQQDGFTLRNVPDILRTPELCHIAVKNFGPALEYVPEKLRTGEICIDAARSTPDRMYFKTGKPYLKHLLQWVPKKLRTVEIYRDMAIENKKLLKYLPAEVKGEVEAAYTRYWAYAFIRRGKIDKAVAYFEEYLKAKPDDASAYNSFAYCYISKGDTAKALETVNKAIDLESDNASFIDTRGEIYTLLGDYEKALADYKKAYDLDPDNSKYDRKAAWEKAKKLYEEKGGGKGKKAPIKPVAGLAEYSETLDASAKASAKKPAAPAAKGKAGTVSAENKKEAERVFFAIRVKKPEKKIEEINKAIALDPTNKMFYEHRAVCRKELDDYEGAIADYTTVYELKGGAMYLFYRAAAYEHIENYEAALADRNAVIKEAGGAQASDFLCRGNTYKLMGDYTKALADYDKAYSLDADYCKNYDEAYEELKKLAGRK